MKRLKEFVEGLSYKVLQQSIAFNDESLYLTALEMIKNRYNITIINISRNENTKPGDIGDIRNDINICLDSIINAMNNASKNGIIFVIFEELFLSKGEAIKYEEKCEFNEIISDFSKKHKNVFFVVNNLFIRDSNATPDEVQMFKDCINNEGVQNIYNNGHIINKSMEFRFGDQDYSADNASQKQLEQLEDDFKYLYECYLLCGKSRILDCVYQNIVNNCNEINVDNFIDLFEFLLHNVILEKLKQKYRNYNNNTNTKVIQNVSEVIHNGEEVVSYAKCGYFNECNDQLINENCIYLSGNGYNKLLRNNFVAKYIYDNCRFEICLDLNLGVGKGVNFLPNERSKQANLYILQSNIISAEDNEDNLPVEVVIDHSDKNVIQQEDGNKSVFVISELANKIQQFSSRYTKQAVQCDVLGTINYNIVSIDLKNYMEV